MQHKKTILLLLFIYKQGWSNLVNLESRYGICYILRDYLLGFLEYYANLLTTLDNKNKDLLILQVYIFILLFWLLRWLIPVPSEFEEIPFYNLYEPAKSTKLITPVFLNPLFFVKAKFEL